MSSFQAVGRLFESGWTHETLIQIKEPAAGILLSYNPRSGNSCFLEDRDVLLSV